MPHALPGFSHLAAGTFVLSAFAAVVPPTLAEPHLPLAPCEKAVPKSTGPAWIHLTLRAEKLVSLRSGGPKNAPVQLPTTDAVAFDGYLPADGSEISVEGGRETAYIGEMSFSNREGKPSETSVQPASVFTGISGTFRALPSADGRIVVTPNITLATDLTLRKSEPGNAGVELPDRRTARINSALTVEGLRCAAHADFTPVSADARKDDAFALYGIHVSALRTQ